MRKDVKTMTREELLANARTFLGAAGVALLLMMGLSFLEPHLGRNREAVAMPLLFLGGFFVLGGVLGGLNFLVRGLLRSRDWRPSEADWKMTDFSPQREVARLSKMIAEELDVAGDLEVVVQPSGIAAPPRDSRSPLRQFLESASPVHVQQTLSCRVPLRARTLEVLVEIGRSTEEDVPQWVGLTLSTPCQVRISQPLRWTKGERALSGEGTLVNQLSALPAFHETLDRLIQHGYDNGTAVVRRSDSAFMLVVDGEGHTVALARTLPQEHHGGFTLRLGLREFLAAVEIIEAHAGPVASDGASRSSP